MRYFIESVTTYSTTGKSRKGALLQAVAKKFEHDIIADDSALREFISTLRHFVTACNNSYPGAPLYLTANKASGRISVHPKATGSEATVFAIHYAPIGDTFDIFSITPALMASIRNLDSKLASAIDELRAQEGGER